MAGKGLTKTIKNVSQKWCDWLENNLYNTVANKNVSRATCRYGVILHRIWHYSRSSGLGVLERIKKNKKLWSLSKTVVFERTRQRATLPQFFLIHDLLIKVPLYKLANCAWSGPCTTNVIDINLKMSLTLI